jgi:hypothetical protein
MRTYFKGSLESAYPLRMMIQLADSRLEIDRV